MKLDLSTMIVGLQADHQLSKQEIARRVGLSRGYVHRLANGEIRRPSFKVVERLVGLQRQLETKSKG